MLLVPASRACSRTAARIPLREMRSPPIPGPPLPTSHITPNQTPGREKAKSGTNGDWRERRLFNSPPPQPSHPPPNQTLGPGAEKKVRWELEDNAHPPKHTTQARSKEMPCSSTMLGKHLGRRTLYRAKDRNYKLFPSSRHPRDRGAPLNPGPPQLAFPLTPNQTLGIEKETPGEGDDRGGDDAHSRSTPIFQPLVQPDLGT